MSSHQKIHFFIFFLAWFFTLHVLAQNRTVTGRVVDANDGLPLPGASVVVKEHTNIGTATDADGQFSLQVPQTAKVLTISMMGMQTAEVAIKTGKSLKIALSESAESLSEAVVLGYGSARKLGSVTGAVATIKGEAFEHIPAANFTDALAGQVAGLSALSSSGEPALSATIRLRGINSISASNAPLIILDGSPINSDTYNALNPSDIASITVLKDASSTAIYGLRAANGVIVITSKKGQFEQTPVVKVGALYGIAQPINSGIKMMNADQYMTLREKLDPALLNNSNWMNHKNIVQKNGIDTDWRDYIYNNHAPTWGINASVQGGSANTNYYISLNHLSKEGIEPLSGIERTSIRFNEDVKINSLFKVGLDINLAYNISQANPEQNSSNVYSNNPTVFSRIARPDDATQYYTVDAEGNATFGARADYLHESKLYNPFYTNEYRERASKTIHIDGTLYEQLTPLPGLTLRANQSLSAYDDKYQYIMRPAETYVSPMGDVVNLFDDGTSAWNAQSTSRYYHFTATHTAEYKFSPFEGHHFAVLLGQESIITEDRGFGVRRYGLTDSRMLLLTNATEEPIVSQPATKTTYNSFFGKISWDYADRYAVDLSIRRDGSSRFSAKHRWATFWSVGGRWNMMNESFMQNLSGLKTVLNQFDWRINYGTTGNSGIGDYTYFGLATSSGIQYNGYSGTLLSQPSVEDLTWETIAQFNVGFDIRLFNRFSISLDFYRKKTSNMLMSIPYSYTTGYAYGNGNIGAMTNQGIDLTLNIDILKNKDFHWDFYANLNYNKNKITALFNGLDEYTIAGTGQKLQVGKPFGEFFLVERQGVDPRDGKQVWYDADGNLTKIYDETNNAVFTGKQRYAPWAGGFGTHFQWRGLYCNIDFTWTLGKWALNNDRYFCENAAFATSYNQSESMQNLWTTAGQVTDIPAATETIQFDTHLLENTSFLRLKRLTIGYDIPQKYLKPLKFVHGINLYASGRNLLTFTKYTGYDPEPDVNIITFNHPNTREYSFGVEITF